MALKPGLRRKNLNTQQSRMEIGQSLAPRLAQFLETLSPDDWQYPSTCTGWEVGDVVGHLAWVAELYIDMITKGRQGDVTPWSNFPDPNNIDLVAYHQFVADTSIAYRKRHGDRLLSTFLDQYEQLQQLLLSLDDDDWNKPCFHPFGMFPIHAFVNLRITELAMHEWDIRYSFDPSFNLVAESIPVFMERVPALRGFRAGAKLSTPIRYRFEVSGPESNTYDIFVEGDTARFETTKSDKATVIFRCDIATFVLVMYGRLTQRAAMDSGRLTGEGDDQLIQTFGQYFDR
jgi:uncharacterized protein (TIGR03083 family)